RGKLVTGVRTCALPICTDVLAQGCVLRHGAARGAHARGHATLGQHVGAMKREDGGGEAGAEDRTRAGHSDSLEVEDAACEARAEIGRASCRERGESAWA